MDKPSRKDTPDLVLLVILEPGTPAPECTCGSDSIRSHAPSRAYDAGWDRTFKADQCKSTLN